MQYSTQPKIRVIPKEENVNEPAYTQEIEEHLALLNPALERWKQGDPMEYAALLSDDVIYFDPRTDGQITGREAVVEHFKPIVGFVQLPKMESSNLKLQIIGDYRILSYNWNEFDAEDEPLNTWNSS